MPSGHGRLAVCVLVLAVGVSCSSDGTSLSAGDGAGRGEQAPHEHSDALEYEAQATVLEEAGGQPELCLGTVLLSLPPQCGGPVVVGLDWDDVPWRETANGVTWADVTAVGTFDGEQFTLTRAVRKRELKQPDDDRLLKVECPTPQGGWKVRDGERIESEEEAGQVARRSSDFSGMWWRYTTPPRGERRDPETAVLHFAFVDNLDAHRAELEKHWGGPLCVVERERSYQELQAIVDDISRDSNELEAAGIDVLSYGPDEVENTVFVEVVLADERTVAELKRRYGEGIVVTGALQPVD